MAANASNFVHIYSVNSYRRQHQCVAAQSHSRIYGSVERDGGDQDPFPLHLSEQRQGLSPLVSFAAGVDRRVKSVPVWLANRISREGVNIECVERVLKNKLRSRARRDDAALCC